MQIADIIVAIMAIAAVIISIISLVFQRRDAARQEKRWRTETKPSLKVDTDSRWLSKTLLTVEIRSCRVVNDGRVPVEIRTLRIVSDEDGKEFSMPPLNEESDAEVIAELWENERPITRPFVPIVIQPGQSVRYATADGFIARTMENAGHEGYSNFKVYVFDALGNCYASPSASVFVSSREPEP